MWFGRIVTYLQQVHTIRLHTIHPLTYGLFHDWSGHFRRSKYAPFCRTNDFDRRLDVFDGSTLSTDDKQKSKGSDKGEGSVASDKER